MKIKGVIEDLKIKKKSLKRKKKEKKKKKRSQNYKKYIYEVCFFFCKVIVGYKNEN